MPTPRSCTVLLANSLVLLLAFHVPASAQEMPSPPEIDRAIERGREFLWSQQLDDGSWPIYRQGDGEWNRAWKSGPTAVATYALLATGVSREDPRMAKALDYLVKHQSEDWNTYTCGLRCNVWLLADRGTRGKYRRQLERDAERLIYSSLIRKGGYHYDTYARSEVERRVRDARANPDKKWKRLKPGGDNSNSQIGLLGVWAGKTGGVEVPGEYWKQAMEFWADRQYRNGGWGYRDPKSGDKRGAYGSMTAAGLASMFICFDEVHAASFAGCNRPEGRDWQTIQKGLAWMEKNIRDSLKGSYGAYYYLYGVERVGLASGRKYFGDVDWFRVGARKIVDSQDDDGSWRDHGHVPGTSFALLFLARGTQPVLFNKLRFDGDWNNRPRDLANLTAWLGHTFETEVYWQIVNLESDVREWHEAPILYISGSRKPRFTDADLAKLKEYVLQGGAILSSTECSGKAFSNEMREVYRRMFPDRELTEVDRDDPLLTRAVAFDLPSAPRVEAITNGARPLVIHVEADLSRDWQLNHAATSKARFELGANLAFHLTDRLRLRRRGVIHWPEKPGTEPASTLTVARVRWKGNWDPEPLAWQRVSRLCSAERGLGVTTRTVDAAKLADCDAPLASLTGTGELTLSEAQRQALAAYVRGGGVLLVDAAGGDAAFARSARERIESALDLRLEPVGNDDDLLATDGEQHPIALRHMRRPGSLLPLRRGRIDGRTAVLLTPMDLHVGLVGASAVGVEGFDPGDGIDPGGAYRLVRNVLTRLVERP